MQSTKLIHDFLVNAVNVDFVKCFLAFGANEGFHFLLALFDNFFDSSRMNSAVGNQFVERATSDFAADRIETGNDYDTGSIVDNHIDTRLFFKGPNVTAFATDDAAFHVVVGNINCAGC